jgi:hypothetical protein
MKKLLLGLTCLPFTTTLAMAQPTQLTDAQMDTVTSGYSQIVIGADTVWDITVIILGQTVHFSNPQLVIIIGG